MSSELRQRGHETDLPAETGAGTDRDITPVPEYAGRNVGMTRAQARAEARAERSEPAADSSGSNRTDSGNTGGVGTDRGESAARESEASQGHVSADHPPDGAGPRGQADAAKDNRESDPRDADYSPQADPAPADKPACGDVRERPTLEGADRQAPSDDSGHDGARSAEGSAADTARREDGAESAERQDRDGHEDEGTGDTESRSSTEPDSKEPAPQRPETTGSETTERKEKDQSAKPDKTPDANPGQPGETITEASPSQHSDAPDLAAIDQRLEAVIEQRVQAALNDFKAEQKAETDVLRAQLTGYMARVDELEDKLETALQERHPRTDRALDDTSQSELSNMTDIIKQGERSDVQSAGDGTEADSIDVIGRANDEADIAAGKAPSAPDRSGLREAGEAGLGIAGQLGLVHPTVQLVLGGGAALRIVKEMPPDEQYEMVGKLNSIVNLSAGMSPGAAILATVTAEYGPAMYTRTREIAQDFWRKIRKKG